MVSKSILEIIHNVEQNNLRIFSVTDLQFNVGRHFLVPKHSKVNTNQIKNILELYSLKTLQQLPLIKFSDPQCRYYGFRVNDVVKVLRNSRTCGKSISYRLVVSEDHIGIS